MNHKQSTLNETDGAANLVWLGKMILVFLCGSLMLYASVYRACCMTDNVIELISFFQIAAIVTIVIIGLLVYALARLAKINGTDRAADTTRIGIMAFLVSFGLLALYTSLYITSEATMTAGNFLFGLLFILITAILLIIIFGCLIYFIVKALFKKIRKINVMLAPWFSLLLFCIALIYTTPYWMIALDYTRFIIFSPCYERVIKERAMDNKKTSKINSVNGQGPIFFLWSLSGFAGQNFWTHLIYDPGNYVKSAIDKGSNGEFSLQDYKKCSSYVTRLSQDFVVVRCHLP